MTLGTSYITEPQPVATASARRRVTIGIPANRDADERRFPFSREGVGRMVDMGYEVLIQQGAAEAIYYSDHHFTAHGAKIVTEAEAFGADIVIALGPIVPECVKAMRRGAMLLTTMRRATESALTVKELIRRNIITVAIDLIANDNGAHPFTDILAEVNGRTAMAVATSILISPVAGKGILLGGVAGINPCEVLIIGADRAGLAAAASAMGLGAMVKIFDNDVYRLRLASETLGRGVTTASLHPRVLESALRTADIVVASSMRRSCTLTPSQTELMKRGVIIIDLNDPASPLCPTLTPLRVTDDMGRTPTKADASSGRICRTEPANAVPRTVAMALSDTFIALFHDIAGCDGAINTVRLIPGLRGAVLTFMGKAVNRRIADLIGSHHIDLNLLLNCS